MWIMVSEINLPIQYARIIIITIELIIKIIENFTNFVQ